MLVIPVYDTLILSNIQINVQEEVFSEQEIENIKEEDEFIIVPITTGQQKGHTMHFRRQQEPWGFYRRR